MKTRYHKFFPSFLSGAILYPIVELLYRGRTHWTMILLGGLSVLTVDLVDRILGKRRFLTKALLSAVLITQYEFIFGVIFNLGFGWAVWDYSDQPLHLLGQICPLFSFYWFLLSFASIFLVRAIRLLCSGFRLRKKA